MPQKTVCDSAANHVDGAYDACWRQWAEERVGAGVAEIQETLSPEETRAALHELRVHQIELEVQNEELRRTEVELEASRMRYFDLYDLAPVAYFTTNKQGLILDANLTATALLGVTRAALVNKPLARFIAHEDQDRYYRHRQQLFETGAPQTCEFRMLRAGAVPFWVRMEAVVAHDDGTPVCRAVANDITEAKESTLKIQNLNVALQKHVAALNEANKDLESYSHFVSHDLRVPLRFVNRIVESLLQEQGASLSKEAVQQMNAILLATGEMEKLIEHLLLFSQSGRMPIRKHPVDLRELFETVARELESTEERGRVEIRIQDLAPCQGDRSLLREVAMNLLANALKFTRPRDPARITIGCTQTEAETIYFVKDNGVGFHMRDAGSLFVPFQRLHKTEDFEGTGIGLALVRRIIERHGGRVWAEGKVGKGTTFYFTLSSKKQIKKTAETPALSAVGFSGKGNGETYDGFKEKGSDCRRRSAVCV